MIVTEQQPMVLVHKNVLNSNWSLAARSVLPSAYILLRVHNVMNACTKDILMNTYYVGHSDILKKHWELGLFASAAVVTTASICMCSSIVHHLSWPQELIRLCWKLFITS